MEGPAAPGRASETGLGLRVQGKREAPGRDPAMRAEKAEGGWAPREGLPHRARAWRRSPGPFRSLQAVGHPGLFSMEPEYKRCFLLGKWPLVLTALRLHDSSFNSIHFYVPTI